MPVLFSFGGAVHYSLSSDGIAAGKCCKMIHNYFFFCEVIAVPGMTYKTLLLQATLNAGSKTDKLQKCSFLFSLVNLEFETERIKVLKAPENINSKEEKISTI